MQEGLLLRRLRRGGLLCLPLPRSLLASVSVLRLHTVSPSDLADFFQRAESNLTTRPALGVLAGPVADCATPSDRTVGQDVPGTVAARLAMAHYAKVTRMAAGVAVDATGGGRADGGQAAEPAEGPECVDMALASAVGRLTAGGN